MYRLFSDWNTSRAPNIKPMILPPAYEGRLFFHRRVSVCPLGKGDIYPYAPIQTGSSQSLLLGRWISRKEGPSQKMSSQKGPHTGRRLTPTKIEYDHPTVPRFPVLVTTIFLHQSKNHSLKSFITEIMIDKWFLLEHFKTERIFLIFTYLKVKFKCFH